jgi:hypothetical protein
MSRTVTAPVPALAAVAACSVLFLGACGSPIDSGPASTTTTSGAVYPITIVRSGGVAGFADKVVIAAAGTAKVTTKSGTSTCTVSPEAMTGLARTAATATGSASRPAQNPDAMAVTLTTSRGSVTLSEGDLPGTAPEVGALLEDLAKPKAQRTVCR